VTPEGLRGERRIFDWLALASAGCCRSTQNEQVANIGQRFWIIRAFPEKPGPTKGNPNSWLSVVVAVLYDREGKVLRRVTARQVVPALARHRVRQLGKHFLWLKGVGGVPGEMPRVNDHNEVELEPVESRPVHLKFQPRGASNG
jgi:hypothetical protein